MPRENYFAYIFTFAGIFSLYSTGTTMNIFAHGKVSMAAIFLFFAVRAQSIKVARRMESNDQEEWVQKLEQKLNELREQRIKVDEANETLRKKLET